jgi:hypothetical protein
MSILLARRALIQTKRIALVVPSFTFGGRVAFSGTGSAGPYTATAVPINAASANRRVYVMCVAQQASLVVSGTPTIGGINCDVVTALGNTAGGNLSCWMISAPVPTGTTANVVFNTTATEFQQFNAYSYTVDTTQLVSIAPGFTNFTTTGSGTSLNGSCAISAFGGDGVFFGFSAFSITNGTQNVSATNCSIVLSAQIGSQAAGFANNVASNPATMTMSWTTATTGAGLAMCSVR